MLRQARIEPHSLAQDDDGLGVLTGIEQHAAKIETRPGVVRAKLHDEGVRGGRFLEPADNRQATAEVLCGIGEIGGFGEGGREGVRRTLMLAGLQQRTAVSIQSFQIVQAGPSVARTVLGLQISLL